MMLNPMRRRGHEASSLLHGARKTSSVGGRAHSQESRGTGTVEGGSNSAGAALCHRLMGLVTLRSCHPACLKPCQLFFFLIFFYSCLMTFPCTFICSWNESTIYSVTQDTLPERSASERREWVQSNVLQHEYKPISNFSYDPLSCPHTPPLGYPKEFPAMDVLQHWSILDEEPQSSDTEESIRKIYQGVCIFDLSADSEKLQQQIRNYREEEVPFVIRNDPNVLNVVEQWSTRNANNEPDHLSKRLRRAVHRVDLTLSRLHWDDSLMTGRRRKRRRITQGIRTRPMTFATWRKWVNQTSSDTIDPLKRKGRYPLFRMDGCPPHRNRLQCRGADFRTYRNFRGFNRFLHLSNANWLYEDLPFFNPTNPAASSLYLAEPQNSFGIHCEFSPKGAMTQAHFDVERNMIVVLGGERRFLLTHPKACRFMSPYERKHPWERHSKVDLTSPNTIGSKFPEFVNQVEMNEVVLQPGDVLYVPSSWFHHSITTSETSYQCNARSGYGVGYNELMDECGFLYPWPIYPKSKDS